MTQKPVAQLGVDIPEAFGLRAENVYAQVLVLSVPALLIQKYKC